MPRRAHNTHIYFKKHPNRPCQRPFFKGERSLDGCWMPGVGGNVSFSSTYEYAETAHKYNYPIHRTTHRKTSSYLRMKISCFVHVGGRFAMQRSITYVISAMCILYVNLESAEIGVRRSARTRAGDKYFTISRQ